MRIYKGEHIPKSSESLCAPGKLATMAILQSRRTKGFYRFPSKVVIALLQPDDPPQVCLRVAKPQTTNLVIAEQMVDRPPAFPRLLLEGPKPFLHLEIRIPSVRNPHRTWKGRHVVNKVSGRVDGIVPRFASSRVGPA